MGDEVRKLKGFDEAKELDVANSKYFKPLTNVKYVLTFAPWEPGLQGTAPIAYDLVEEMVPDYHDKTKKVKSVVLKVRIDSIDGKPVAQEWSILSQKVRNLLQPACESGNLLKKKYAYQSTGEGAKKMFSFNEVGDR